MYFTASFGRDHRAAIAQRVTGLPSHQALAGAG
jgi:hypothetical protein